MKNRWNAVWTRFRQWLDQYAVALAYDIGDLHAGIARVEEEPQVRECGADTSQSVTRLSHNISRARH